MPRIRLSYTSAFKKAKSFGLPVEGRRRKKPLKSPDRIAEEFERLQDTLNYSHCIAIHKNPELVEVVVAEWGIPASLVKRAAADRVKYGKTVEVARRYLLKTEIKERIPKHLRAEYTRAVDFLAQVAKDHKILGNLEAERAENGVRKILDKFIPEKKAEFERRVWFMTASPYYVPTF